MRKISLFFLVIIFILILSLTIFACNKPKEKTHNYSVIIDENIIKRPSDLQGKALEIEWFDEDGNTTAFKPNRPTVILFNGYSEFNRKENLTLPTELYDYNENKDIVSSTLGTKLKLNLSYYWKKLGNFNIGVFHYENFADEENMAVINSKIYDKSLSTYKVNATTTVKASFNLTHAFYSAWKKDIVDKKLLSNDDAPDNLQEIRFIGNSIGANMAVSCADYLYAAMEQNIISATYVPNRLTLTNPWLSNDEDFKTKVNFRKDEVISSALSYNNSRIKELADKGVVFEIVEGDSNFANSYEKIYDGCLNVSTEGKSSLLWGDGTDTNLYDEIKEKVAYLTFSETYSSKFTDQYKKYDRAVLDWYLYTAGGSDNTSITTQRAGFIPVYDSYGHPSVTHYAGSDGRSSGYSLKYGLSAWTPTTYTRAMRGVEYSMKLFSSYSSQPSEDYIMTSFQAEAKQMSNLTMESGFFICGYIYNSLDKSEFVNLRPDAQMGGYTFSISVSPDKTEFPELSDQVFSVTTEKDGFYKCNLNLKLVGSTAKITMSAPSHKFKFFDSNDLSKGNLWQICDKNVIGREGITKTMFGTKDSNFYIAIFNCGFLNLPSQDVLAD